MGSSSAFGAFLDPVADKVNTFLLFFPLKHEIFILPLCSYFWRMILSFIFSYRFVLQLMVAAALVLLCTRPLPMSGFATIPWLLPVPTIAIIGREVHTSLLDLIFH